MMRLLDDRSSRRGALEDTTRVPALVEYLARIPEYRAARGERYPLLALLRLVCVAMRCGARGQAAIADWGRFHGQPWLRRLGFTRGRGPSQPTLRRLCRAVPHATVEAALGRWAEQALRRCPPAPGALAGLAVDGKTLRGSTRRGGARPSPPAACCHRFGVMLGQVGVPDKTNAIGAARDLLRALLLEGRVVTAAALLTQRAIAQTILTGRGDDPLAVKANQPQLRAAVLAAFAPGADDTGAIGAACTVTQHGGRLAWRTLTATAALVGYSAWPGLRQALKLERRVLHKATGRVLRQEFAYAVTSCAPERATPAQLLALWRGHWTIENRLHYIRDVTFEEDRATTRAAHAPQVMAALRNTIIALHRRLGATNIAAACRRCAARPACALAAIGLTDFE